VLFAIFRGCHLEDNGSGGGTRYRESVPMNVAGNIYMLNCTHRLFVHGVQAIGYISNWYMHNCTFLGITGSVIWARDSALNRGVITNCIVIDLPGYSYFNNQWMYDAGEFILECSCWWTNLAHRKILLKRRKESR
jgi:hypothetical protein